MSKHFTLLCAVLLSASALTFVSCGDDDDDAQPATTKPTDHTPDQSSGVDGDEPDRPTPIGSAVDLGLSVKWANMNIGANQESDYGYYFAWGELESKTNFNADVNSWYKSTIDVLKTAGVIDDNNNLTPEHDVASLRWGNKWRMPTKAEIEELIKNCSLKIEKVNNVNGCRLTSNKNGNSIFLPFAGDRYEAGQSDCGIHVFFWSSTAMELSRHSYGFYANEMETIYLKDFERYGGHVVRPVQVKK